ncbi:unnamed protein product [Acanthosepion pharaonis]|uniref:DUF4371 domain-containing protein n=1 Tax=Acanthosepion pharaonis TaxID=158019 RepID=A0A812BRL0_ACAPH|nr:unnamed protein product [Sepia pharaonis]
MPNESLSLSLSIYLSIYSLHIYLSIYLCKLFISIYLSTYLCISSYLSMYVISSYLSIYLCSLFIPMSIYVVSSYLSIYLYLEKQLKHKIKSFIAFSVAIDESTDITDVVQLAIFIRGVDKTLTVSGEFLELVPMMDTRTANDIFISIVGALDRSVRTRPVLPAWLQISLHQ